MWFNTNSQGEQGEDEEEEGEELVDEVEPEVGPSLLTSISDDAEVSIIISKNIFADKF